MIINAIRTEIKNFLITYPQPTLTDIDDLVEHNHLLNLNIKEDELRLLILYEMLYGKFNESGDSDRYLDEIIELITPVRNIDVIYGR